MASSAEQQFSASREWQEFLQLSRFQQKLLQAGPDRQSEPYSIEPDRDLLGSWNPVALTHSNNQILAYDGKIQQKLITEISSAIAAGQALPIGQLKRYSLVLGYHGYKISNVCEMFFIYCFKQFLKSNDAKYRNEVILAAAQVAGYQMPGTAMNSIAKDLIKALKASANFENVAFIQFVYQLLHSPFIKTESNPLVTKSLLFDLDTILKNLIVAFNERDDTVGNGKIATATLLCYLLSNFCCKAVAFEAPVKKRLTRLIDVFTFKDHMDSTCPEYQLLNSLIPKSDNIIPFMIPLYVLGSFLTKYRRKPKIIFGIMETFNLWLLRMGSQLVQEHLLTLLRFFTELATNPCMNIEFIPSNSYLKSMNFEDDWIETSILRRDMLSQLILKTICQELLAGSILDVNQNVFGLQTLEPFVKFLSKFAPVGEDVELPSSIIDSLTFILEQLSNFLVEIGGFGSFSSVSTETLIDDLLSLWSLVFQIDASIRVKFLPLEFYSVFAHTFKSVVGANPNNNSGILSKSLLLFSSQLDAYEFSESVDYTTVDRLIGTAIILNSVISIVRYHSLHVGDLILNQLCTLSNRYIQRSTQLQEEIFKNAASSDIFLWKKAASYAWIGWNLMSALLTLDSTFIKSQVPQWLLTWKTFLARLPQNVNLNNFPAEYIMWIIVVREAALGAMETFMRNHPSLCTADICKRLVSNVVVTVSILNTIPDATKKRIEQISLLKPPRLQHLQFSINRNCLKQSSATALSTSTTSSFLNDVSLFLENFPQKGDVASNLCLMSIYPRPVTHFQLLQKRIFSIFRIAAANYDTLPVFYESLHVALTRQIMEITGGNYLSLGSSFDPSKVEALYSTSESGKLDCDKNELLLETSLLRGISVDAKIVKERLQPLRSLLRRIEGSSHADLAETDRMVQWIRSAVENDVSSLWSLIDNNSQSNADEVFEKHRESALPAGGCPKVFLLRPLPSSVVVVDEAIILQGLLFLYQNASLKETFIDQLLKTVKILIAHQTMAVGMSDEIKQVISSRVQVTQMNCLSILLSAYQWNNFFKQNKTGQNVRFNHGERLINLIQELCLTCWTSSNSSVRSLASLTLSQTVKNTFDQNSKLSSKYFHEIVKLCYETISSSSKDANLRSGAVLGLAYVLKFANNASLNSSQIKTFFEVMETLINDQHVTVHIWSLFSLSTVLESTAGNWIAALGTKEFVGFLFRILFVKCDEINGNIGNAISGSLPSITCTARLRLRIIQSLLSAYGPEMMMPEAVDTVEIVHSLIQLTESGLFVSRKLLNPPPYVVSSADMTLVPPVLLQFSLLNAPFSPIKSSEGQLYPFRPFSVFTSPDSSLVLMEKFNCYYQFVVFNCFKYVPRSLFLEAQIVLGSSSSHRAPQFLIRSIVSFLWSSVAADAIAEELWISYPLDLLVYLLDHILKSESIRNGGSAGGCFEDDLTLQDDGLIVGSSPHSYGATASQVKNIVFKWYDNDRKNSKGNRWLALCQRILLRNAIAPRINDFTDWFRKQSAAINPALKTATKTAASKDQKASDQGKKDDDSDAEQDKEEHAEKDADNDAAGDDGFVAENTEEPSGTLQVEDQAASIVASPLSDQFSSASVDIKDVVSEKFQQAIIAGSLPSFHICCWAVKILNTVLCDGFEHSLRQEKDWDAIAAKQFLAFAGAKNVIGKFFEFEDEAAPNYPIVLKLNSLIKMAFGASTDTLAPESIRVQGVRLLKMIVRIFKDVKDPIYPKSSILEQYEAQLVSAICSPLKYTEEELKIAVSIYPQLQISALELCAYFCSSGVADIKGLGRIISVMTSYATLFELENADEDTGLDASTQSLVRVAVCSSWAELISSPRIPDADKQTVIQPVVPLLVDQWFNIIKHLLLSAENGQQRRAGSLQAFIEEKYTAKQYSVADGLTFCLEKFGDTVCNEIVDLPKKLMITYAFAIRSIVELNDLSHLSLLNSILTPSFQSAGFHLDSKCLSELISILQTAKPTNYSVILQIIEKILRLASLDGADDMYDAIIRLLTKVVIGASVTDKEHMIELLSDITAQLPPQQSENKAKLLKLILQVLGSNAETLPAAKLANLLLSSCIGVEELQNEQQLSKFAVQHLERLLQKLSDAFTSNELKKTILLTTVSIAVKCPRISAELSGSLIDALKSQLESSSTNPEVQMVILKCIKTCIVLLPDSEVNEWKWHLARLLISNAQISTQKNAAVQGEYGSALVEQYIKYQQSHSDAADKCRLLFAMTLMRLYTLQMTAALLQLASKCPTDFRNFITEMNSRNQQISTGIERLIRRHLQQQ